MSKSLGLPRVCPKVAELTGQPLPGGYNRLYAAVVDGRIPARNENGRWYVSENDLPAVASVFGLIIPNQSATT